MSIETNGMLLDIDLVLKQHLSQQMEKVLKENKEMKITMHILKNTPLFRKMKQENDQLKKNNNILAKNIIKFKKKIEEYENHPNINLEIKEISGNDEEKLTVAEIKWAKIVNAKIEDEEVSLDDDLAQLGINNLGEDDDDDEDEDEDGDEDGEDEDGDEDGEDEDGEDEEDEDDDEEEDNQEEDAQQNIQDHEGDELEDANKDFSDCGEPIDIWTSGIENNFSNDEDEISDNEEGAKIYIFQDKKYYIEDKLNGKIFENIEGKLGKVVGRLEDGHPFFS
jgi:uncharacterized protein YvpB